MDFSSVRSSVRSHSLLLSCSSSKRRLFLHAKIAQYRSCPFFFADNSANHFLDSAMILRAVVVDGGYGSLLKAGFCPAFAVQRKLAFFSACLVAVKLLPLGFVNCNLNQQVWTSTCWLKKRAARIALACPWFSTCRADAENGGMYLILKTRQGFTEHLVKS